MQKDSTLTVLAADSGVAAAAVPSMRATSAKHFLQKDTEPSRTDSILSQAIEEEATMDAVGVNLAQTHATVIPGRHGARASGNPYFPLYAAIGALAIAYCTVSETPGGSVVQTIFEAERLSSKAD